MLGVLALASLSNAHAAALTWTGLAGDNLVSTAGNWSPVQAPNSNSDLIINSSNAAIVWDVSVVRSLVMDPPYAGTVTLSSALSTVFSLSVNSGTLITAKDSSTTISPGLDLNIGSAGVILVRRRSTAANGLGQTILVGGNLTVAAGGKILADGQGFSAGSGPSAGTSQSHDGSGGGHGGLGADSSAKFGGVRYGSAANPTSLGSGGGVGLSGQGAGGGAMHVQVSGSATVDGTISANGADCGAGNLGGGGAGGSIWLDVASAFSGAGLISANGGNSDGATNGGGSGGRIAITWATTTFSGTVGAAPGIGGGGRGAEPGTYVFPDGNDLIVKASLALVPGTCTIPTLSIQNNATLLLQGDATALPNGSGVTINSTTVSIAAGATLSANGQGFPTTAGPGHGDNQACDGSGGGYGGTGGATTVKPGGVAYGSITSPTALGSGGGAGCAGGSTGTGAGGGAITLNVSGAITINGAITANGIFAVTNSNGGGGSGGSIWIVANSISGSGQINADGGNGDGSANGGGAGGRISIHPSTVTTPFAYTFSGPITANAGTGGSTVATGGSIYIPPLISSAADQFFPGNGPSTAMQALTITNRAYANAAISAANGVRIKVPATFNMNWDPAFTTATLSGPQAAKISAAVSYPSSRVLALTVLSDFGPGESFTLSGLSFMNFLAGSNPNPDALELEILNNGVSQAKDAHTVRIKEVTAFDDGIYSVVTGNTLNIGAPGVLGNDTEISNHAITASPMTLPAHGNLTLNANGSFSYTPAAHYIGSDSFTYVANNGTTDSLPATVTISVSKTVLTVTALNAARVYGAQQPVFSAVFSGFVNGDDISAISGAPAFSTPATLTSGVGNYAILPSLGTLNSSSYSFAFVAGTLTINKAVLTVSANNATKPYGAPIPNLPYAFSGFLFTDNQNVVSGTPLLSTTATPSSLEGNFPITVAQGTLVAANYSFAFNPGTLKIVPSPPAIGSISLLPNPATSGQNVSGSVDVTTTAGVNASVLWDFGDGTTASGASIQHSWKNAGAYTVTITATGGDGIATSATQQMLISLTAGPSGPDPIDIGGGGPSAKLGKASAKINFAHRDKTTLTGSLSALNFPAMKQSDLQLLPGTLTIGTGANQQAYQFSLDKSGRASATGVKISVTTKKGTLAFTVSGRAGLTDLFESLGASSTIPKKSPPVPIAVPATLRIGDALFLAMTFNMNYVAKGSSGAAATPK